MSGDVRSQRGQRGWVTAAVVGFGMVVLAMVTVGLVIADKRHFGELVGWAFLPVITSGVVVGGAVMFIAVLFTRERTNWRGLTLIVWSLIAASSPLFGLMFLLPWALLAVSAPLVVWLLVRMRRAAAAI